MGGTDTRSSVLDGVAIKHVSIYIPSIQGINILRDREFAQVVSNHFWLNFNLVENLSRVDTNNTANHLWDDDHVSEMGLDEVWLLIWLGLLLCLTELLDQTHWLALETTVEPTTGTGVDNIAELIGGEIEESAERI